jgi:hypothetical protein
VVNKQTRNYLVVQNSTASPSEPPHIRVSGKSGSRFPLVGSGSHTYECIHDWLVPPQDFVWGNTHGLCQDEQGNIYVGHTVHRSSMRGDAIFVFDQEGRFVRAFGEEFTGGSHGLRLRREAGHEVLYHSDINRCQKHHDRVWPESLRAHCQG